MANNKEGYKRVEMRVNLKTYERIKNIADIWTNGNVSDAFPIIVYLKQMEDYQRKVVEVTECVNEDGKRRYVPLWEYVVDEIVEDANGEKKVIGFFRKVNNISEKLQRRLKQNGIARNELQTMLSNYVEES